MSTAREFLDAFVVERDYQTGGGCTAWHLPLPNGFYVLVTEDMDALQPDENSEKLAVGLYDPDGDEHDLRDGASWATAIVQVKFWISHVPALAKARAEVDETRNESEAP